MNYKRILLYTGKGGVGKTTLSAATALRCAELGYKTIVISTDAAHSLADSFNINLEEVPKKVYPNLYALEINVNYELKHNWGKIQAFMSEFLKWRGFDELMAEEFAIFPGMEELFSLLKLKEFYETGDFKVIIIDCAPTASTLRMLSFPDVMGWYMEKFFHIERKIVKGIRPIVKRVSNIPIPKDDVYYSIEELYNKIGGTKELLTNPEISSARIVINLEKMVIKESQRINTYLNLFDFPVDAVFVNRILPSEAKNPYFNNWISTQQKYLQIAEDSFKPLPLFKLPLYKNEISGLDSLATMAQEVFSDKNPTEIFCREKALDITKQDSGYLMSLKLPFFNRKDLDVWTREDELTVQIKNYKRNILLPSTLANLELKHALLEGDILKIYFGGEKNAKEK